MTNQYVKNPLKLLLALLRPGLVLLGLGLIAVNAMEYWNLQQQLQAQYKGKYQTGTERAARDMAQLFRNVEREAESLAAAISDGSYSEDDHKAALAEMLNLDPIFYGAAIAFAPYAFDSERRLYAPYYSKSGGSLEFLYIEDSYDYTLDEQEWFVEAMASGPRWSTPYFDDSVGDILMTTYSAVVYQEDATGSRIPIAVVTIDVSIDAIGDITKTVGLGGTSYAEIVTSEGLYLYSPTHSRVFDSETLFASSRWTQDPALERLRELIRGKESGVEKLYDTSDGTAQWVSVAPITGTPWHLLGNFADAEVEPRTSALRHRLMYITLGTVLLLGTILVLRQVVPPGPGAVISWPTAILLSLVLLVGTFQVWRIAMNYSSDNDREVFAVSSSQAVAKEIRDYQQRALEHLTEPPIIIPTGIYIESMRFLGSNDLRVVGAIWQKFDLDEVPELDRGIVLPGAARVQISEPFIHRTGNTELIRWQFSGEWRFSHHYARYPLMKDVFGVGIFSRDTAENVLLVPDTESYPYLSPSSLPGLSPDAFLLGWRIENTFFELRPWRHNVTFGTDPSLKVEAMPELYFSVEMEKAFIHSVISNLTPLAIALTIAFITLLISTRDKNRLEFMRTGVGFDIGICTSIFFVVVLSHISLRQRIVSEEIFYLEYFYLLMYTNLIWVCCHSILAAVDHPVLDKLTLGVSAKKAYFPVNFVLIFGVTWLVFYW